MWLPGKGRKEPFRFHCRNATICYHINGHCTDESLLCCYPLQLQGSTMKSGSSTADMVLPALPSQSQIRDPKNDQTANCSQNGRTIESCFYFLALQDTKNDKLCLMVSSYIVRLLTSAVVDSLHLHSTALGIEH